MKKGEADKEEEKEKEKLLCLLRWAIFQLNCPDHDTLTVSHAGSRMNWKSPVLHHQIFPSLMLCLACVWALGWCQIQHIILLPVLKRHSSQRVTLRSGRICWDIYSVVYLPSCRRARLVLVSNTEEIHPPEALLTATGAPVGCPPSCFPLKQHLLCTCWVPCSVQGTDGIAMNKSEPLTSGNYWVRWESTLVSCAIGHKNNEKQAALFLNPYYVSGTMQKSNDYISLSTILDTLI